ncbi:MAG: leucine-rich repeat protein [Firmicutes bacterium]|nr:leucine-rich repeat protein [Bacillota bacterium]
MLKKAMSAAMAAFIMTSCYAGSVYAQAQWIEKEINGVQFQLDSYNGSLEKKNKPTNLGKDSDPKQSLKTVDISIPDSIEGTKVTSIAKNGLCDLDEMKSIKLTDSVTEIGEYAFSGCDNLTSFTFPKNVKEVPASCFLSCDNLSTIKYNDNIKKIGNNAFEKCKAMKSVTIPKTVTEIGAGAYSYSGVERVVIPDTVTSIDDGAFKECKSLTSATLGKGIKDVTKNMFNGDSALTTVIINSGTEKIDHAAFANCSALTSVTVPDTVKSIAEDAFNGCPNVTFNCKKGSYAEAFAIKKGYGYNTGASETPIVVPDRITILLNGKELECSQPPVNKSGSVIVPMRAIFEALGAEVKWNNSDKSIFASKGVTSVQCWIGSKDVVLNNKKDKMLAAPEIINGATMVPARFVSEAFGAQVSWDAATQTVTIVTK